MCVWCAYSLFLRLYVILMTSGVRSEWISVRFPCQAQGWHIQYFLNEIRVYYVIFVSVCVCVCVQPQQPGFQLVTFSLATMALFIGIVQRLLNEKGREGVSIYHSKCV